MTDRDWWYREWEAWQLVGKRWADHTAEMNDETNNGLVHAIEFWGECLVQLRLRQDDNIRTSAYNEKARKAARG